MAKVGVKRKNEEVVEEVGQQLVVELDKDPIKLSTRKVTRTVPAAKVEKKAKAVKPKATKVKAAKAEKQEDTRKIKLLVKENPKREGTESYKRFELYSKHNTVQAFLDAGGSRGDLAYDSKNKYIEVK